MLGRRQIREKIVQTLYAYYQNPIKHDVLEKNMFSDIEKITLLYVYQLNFLVALKELAENQIEIHKKKFLKTEEDLNPNQKFIRNQALIQLENNQERLSISGKHTEIRWELHDDLLVKTFRKIIAGKRFQDYMTSETLSFEDDQKFLGKIFLKYVAENDAFRSHVEEKELNWEDDLHISNSMCQKTIGFLKEQEPCHTLMKVIKDDELRDFASRLLNEALTHWKDIEKKVEERLENWDLNRISLLDKIILIAAISELDCFPATPSRVIINEYVEISKTFSTEKSHIFVNGILDRYIKDFCRI